MFIPKHEHKREHRAYCQWCAATNVRRAMYKLRDGPIDWWFCDEDHAVEWLEHRHRTPGIHAFLALTPVQRACFLGESTQDEFIKMELRNI